MYVFYHTAYRVIGKYIQARVYGSQNSHQDFVAEVINNPFII